MEDEDGTWDGVDGEGGTTHHLGCACHEAARDAEVASLRTELAALRAEVDRAKATIDALALVCDRIRAAHGMGCKCIDCRETRDALNAYGGKP